MSAFKKGVNKVKSGPDSPITTMMREEEDEASVVTGPQEASDLDKDDLRTLRLLDSLDQLLQLRDSLSRTLSRGWMEMAAARYAMGPSRISQALLSLKPCHAATVVSVSRAKILAPDEGKIEDWPSFEVCRHISEEGSSPSSDEDLLMPKITELSCTQGVSKDMIEKDKEMNDKIMEGPTSRMQIPTRKASGKTDFKQTADPSVWFGTLVSPHLRTAQSSFAAALEFLVELATLQGSIKAAYSEITKSGGYSKVEHGSAAESY